MTSIVPEDDAQVRVTLSGDQFEVPFDFAIKAAADVRVSYLGVDADDWEDWTLDADYTLSDWEGNPDGGNLNVYQDEFDPRVITAGDILVMWNDPPVARTTEFASSALNGQFAALVMMLQRQRDRTLRSIRVNDRDTIPADFSLQPGADRAGMVLSFDDDGRPEVVLSREAVEEAYDTVQAVLEYLTAEFILKTNLPGFPNGRALAQSDTIDWNYGTAGAAKGDVRTNSILDTLIRQAAGLSVIGRAGNTTGNVADIVAADDGGVLRRSGTALGFGTLIAASFADNTISRARLLNGTATSIIGRSANSDGAVADIAATSDGDVLRRAGGVLGFGALAQSSITGLVALLATLAPLASPELTGVPTAPTPALGTNTTQIATMAAIQAAIGDLINAAPGALNTLDELANALGDDPNFATTVTNALALKQPLDADLTSIAALTTTTFGRNFLELADAAAGISKIGAIAASLLTTRGDMIRRGAAGPERFAKGAANTLLAMGADDPAWSTLSALFDAVFGNTRGAILYRGATGWEKLDPSTSGYVLTTLGAGADPAWAEGAAGGGGGAGDEELAQIYMGQSDALGAVVHFLNGFADAFDVTTGIDAANSSNEDLTEAGVIKQTSTSSLINFAGGTNRGDLTSSPNNAFDGNGATAAQSAGAVSAGWLGRTPVAPSAVSRALVAGPSSGGGYTDTGISTTIALYGKNGTAPASATDGTLLGSITFTCLANESVPREITSSDATTVFDHLWVRITRAAGTGTMSLSELSMYGAITHNNLDARSASVAISDEPVSASVFMLIEPTDALTVNTDFKMYASRIGNTGYVEGTEQKLGTVNGLELWAATGIDLSGQASGSNLRWRGAAANNKRLKIHAACVIGHPA